MLTSWAGLGCGMLSVKDSSVPTYAMGLLIIIIMMIMMMIMMMMIMMMRMMMNDDDEHVDVDDVWS